MHYPETPAPPTQPRRPGPSSPPQVVTTRWGSDPFAYGSYSSMAVGTKGGEDYDVMAESVAGRVRASGEAQGSGAGQAPWCAATVCYLGQWVEGD